MIAVAERGQHLVAGGAGLGTDRVDAALGTDQLGEGAGSAKMRFESAHVECDEIHGDTPDDRYELAGDGGMTSVAEGPQPPICITDGHGGDAARPIPAISRTITNGNISVNV